MEEERQFHLKRVKKFNLDPSVVDDVMNNRYSSNIDSFLRSINNRQQLESLYLLYNDAIDIFNSNNNTNYSKYIPGITNIDIIYSNVNKSTTSKNSKKSIKTPKFIPKATPKTIVEVISKPSQEKEYIKDRCIDKPLLNKTNPIEEVISKSIDDNIITVSEQSISKLDKSSITPIKIIENANVKTIVKTQIDIIIKLVLGLIAIILSYICYVIYNTYNALAVILAIIIIILLIIIIFN